MKKILVILGLVFLWSCSKDDVMELPNYIEDGSLFIAWTYGNDVKQYKIGENALSAKSFVIENDSILNRQFVFQYIIDSTKQIDVIFCSPSQSIITATDLDILSTLHLGTEFDYNYNEELEPGTVSITYHDNMNSYFSSSLTQQNSQNAVFKIIDSELIERVDGSQYLEIDFEFNCAMHHNSQNVIIYCNNGIGKLAFKL